MITLKKVADQLTQLVEGGQLADGKVTLYRLSKQYSRSQVEQIINFALDAVYGKPKETPLVKTGQGDFSQEIYPSDLT